MKQCILILAVLAYLGGSQAGSKAAAPLNDNFVNRIALNGALVTTTGSSVDATAEAGEPIHYGLGQNNGGRSAWWSWTAPTNGQATITTAGSGFDTILAVYTGGAVNALSLVATNDNDAVLSVNTSRVQFNASSGTTYQIAVDGFGLFPSGSSGNITLNILGPGGGTPVTLIATGSVWKYLDDGADQGTAWRALNFPDGSWAAGPGELGYGDLPDGRPEVTVLCCSNAATKFLTYYFRRTVVLTNASSFVSLTARVLRDDGAVVYLNGTEAFRMNMPSGTINAAALASSPVGGADEATYFPTNINPALLVEGTNIIAVEVHQNATTSSDLSFDLELTGVRAGSNAPPIASLTAPSNNTTSAAPAAFTLSANASDPDGGVARVDFYAASTLIASDATSPFSIVWSNVIAGTSALRAVAVDGFGLTGTSAPISITVTGNAPPFASVTLPTDGSVFIAPASIVINATASDLDGTVTNVQFYRGNTKIGDDASSPYAFTNSPVAVGSYTYRVVAMDNFGARGTSAVVNVTVNPNTPPVVTLTSPANNSTYAAPANISLAANATDLEAPVASVAFQANGALLGTATASPFTFDWSGVVTGSYALRAIATDSGGLMATSPVVNVTVQSSGSAMLVTNFLVSYNSAGWKYLDNGSDQGTSWQARLFNDSAWSNGVAQLGYGDGDEATVVRFGPDANNKHITTWFRKSFVVNNPGNYTNLQMWLLRDDGGVVYLNGTEIYRSPSLPAGTILFNTLAPGNGENSVDQADASAYLGQLVDGTNVVAVEIHQQTLSSSDISMDLQLVGTAVFMTGSNLPPVATLTSPANGANYNPPPATIVIDATGSDSDGTVSKVEFYSNGVKIGEDNTAPYQFTQGGVGNGSYALLAVATDNLGARGTSAPVNVTVSGTVSSPPTVSILAPADGATYRAPTNLNVTVNAADPGGSVARVEYFRSGVKVGESTTPPFNFTWTNTLIGAFQLTALATDNLGALGTSAPISLTFTSAAPSLIFPFGSIWKYLDTGVDLGTSWTAPSFDDAAWLTGPGELGYGDGDEATVVGFGPNANSRYITTYFRRAFVVADPGAYSALQVMFRRDDGIIGYLNDVEVLRNNLSGTVNYTTLAQLATDDGVTIFTNTISSSLLVPGTNFFAVEIHQNSPASSDISFDLMLRGNTGAIVNDPPTVALTSPPNNSVYTEPASLTLTANAIDPDGTIAKVEFFAGAVKLGERTVAPYTFNWSGVPIGNYALTTIATDNLGATATSAPPVNVFVVASTAPELVSRAPAPGAVNSLTQVTLQFSEPVDGVDASDLLINETPASSVTGSNATYTFSFPQPLDGVVSVRFAATAGIVDRESPPKPFDSSATNAAWRYTLADNIPPTVASVSPLPGAVIKSLTIVSVIFSEPVGRVDASDLRINGAGATAVTGAGAGPYEFSFTQPANGTVTLAWTNTHGIRDFAAAPNAFAGGAWNYSLNPAAVLTNIVLNEIMYHPLHNSAAYVPEPVNEEYVELFNRGATAVNLHGWRIRSGVSYTFSNVTLNAGAYLVVAADLPTFRAKYPTVTNVVGPFEGRLSNTEDTLNLDDAGGSRIDSVPYTDEGDWGLRRQLPDETGSGQLSWEWTSPADGQGSSIELINPALPNQYGQNWIASPANNGTPGRVNGAGTNNAAPFILDATHAPAIPRSTNTIFITARLLDEQTAGLSATLHSRVASVTPSNQLGAFLASAMFDDGAHGDGLAGDGVFGASLTPSADLTILEYYIRASDAGGRARTWPAPTEANGTQGANALLQVDDGFYNGPQPVFRVIMTGPENQRLADLNRTNPGANAKVNATFISTDGVRMQSRYLASVRHRGAGSRGAQPPNLRIQFATDLRWNRVTALNLNSLYTHSQVPGSVLSRKAGLASEEAVAVQVRRSGTNAASANSPQFGSFVWLESRDSDWAANHFPEDANGNLYSCVRPNSGLAALGNYSSSSIDGAGYTKSSNQSQNDYSDIASLITTLTNTADAQYPSAVRARLNVEQWFRHFAVLSLLGYGETAIGSDGSPDDYTLYRGLLDPRFVLIPHDHDTDLGQGDGSRRPTTDTIWRAANGNGVLAGLMRHPEFAPIYFRELKYQLETTFRPGAVARVLDEIFRGWPVASSTILAMKDWATNRSANVWAQLPTNFTVTVALPVVSGYPQTTTGSIALSGQANALVTHAVRVNGQTASWTPWQGTWSMSGLVIPPGVNRLVVQALDGNGAVLDERFVDVWHDDGSTVNLSGAITGTQTLTASGGPYHITGSLVVGSGATLVIQPGASLHFDSEVTLTVTGGGRLLAEGTEAQRIRFTRAPGAAGNWGGIVIENDPLESRIAYAYFDGCDGTTLGGQAAMIHVNNARLFMDHCSFANTPAVRYLSFNNSSFVVQHSAFPSYPFASSAPGLVRGVNGIPPNGYGIFRDNQFGRTWGTNDTIDFAGGNRPGAILQIIKNVFDGAGDEQLDLDSTDAWIEGNIFLHAHRDSQRTDSLLDTANAIGGGTKFAGQFSEWTIINNLFYDVDHAVLAKQGARFTFVNNTLVRVNQGNGSGQPGDIGAFNFSDMGHPHPDASLGAGAYIAGNILWDAPALAVNYNASNLTVIFENNLLPSQWSGPGSNNVVADPLLDLSLISNPLTAGWRAVKAALTPKAGSPALGTGLGGFDKGGLNPRGLLVWGEPVGATPLTSATLRVGPGGTINWGSSVPPYAWGYTHYRWRLDDGAWSAESPVATAISLSGLSDGPHTVQVSGRNDAGHYQDDALVYPSGVPTASRTWLVNGLKSAVRFSEALARNVSAVPVGAAFPDLLELHNPGSNAVSLAGMGLSDDAAQPFRFTFPPGASIGAGQYLVLYADSDATPPGFHLGFSLNQVGEKLTLTASNGMTLDVVEFGMQLPDLSVGRGVDGVWRLNVPTFGTANVAAPAGDPRALLINEWLASGLSPYPDDFIELFNPGALPVDLGALFLTDNPIGAPLLNDVVPLSFIAAGGYAVFTADGGPGADHVNFKLRAEQGMIALMAADASIIDCVIYGPQTTDVSMGRQPNGAATLGYFTTPTPGSPNASVIPPNSTVVINEVLALNLSKRTTDGSTPDWVEFYNPTGTNVDLADLSLSDSAVSRRKYIFPPGSIVPAQGFFSIRLDPDLAAGPTNAGFGLKSTGQSLALYDRPANGGGPLSAVSFGVQAADFSIGRVPDGSTNWVLCIESIGFANNSVVLGNAANLKVNEWMANAPSGEDDWFEVFNPNAQPVALGGLHVSDNLSTPAGRTKHRIAALSFVGVEGYAYQRFEADNNAAAGPEHVAFALAAGGEQIGICSAEGAVIDGYTFGAQVSGVSQGRLPDGAATVVSFPGTVSPGDPNYVLLASVAVNEALSHTDAPLEDAIELRNLTGTAINIGGWFVSDAKHSLKKFRIPDGTILGANGFRVFYEYQFNDTNGNPEGAFSLSSSKGDEIYLGQATTGDVLTGFRAQVKFGASENGVSFGRHMTSVGESHFVAMSRRTFGQDNPDTVAEFRMGIGLVNPYPAVGPVVIGEIMYHPPNLGTNDDTVHEFIELRNITGVAQPLFHPAFPANTWRLRDGISFNFPMGTVLPAGGQLLVVSFSPSDSAALNDFRSYYGIGPATVVLGPWSGKLDNGGESIELYKPDAPQPDGDVPQVLVERIKYSDKAPWPTNAADGGGFSLQRVGLDEYGNDPAPWTEATPTPGPAGNGDSDNDGMPDAWELHYGLTVGVNDAAGDLDGDGVSNLNEFLSGTLPNDANSFLQLLITGVGPVTLRFNAASNLTYSVSFKDTLTAPAWTKLADVPAGAARVVQLTDLGAGGVTRFYRLRTPQEP